MEAEVQLGPHVGYCLIPAGGADDDQQPRSIPGPLPVEREDLPYKVELWDDQRSAVEQVLAVTANGSIGYAAFYAATRDFPNRLITLRHKNRVVSRWAGQAH